MTAFIEDILTRIQDLLELAPPVSNSFTDTGDPSPFPY